MASLTTRLFRWVAEVFQVGDELNVPTQVNIKEGINFTFDLERRASALQGRFQTLGGRVTLAAAGEDTTLIDPFASGTESGDPPPLRWDAETEDLWVLEVFMFQVSVTAPAVVGAALVGWRPGNGPHGFYEGGPGLTTQLLAFTNTVVSAVPAPLLGASTTAVLELPFKVDPGDVDGTQFFALTLVQIGVGAVEVSFDITCWIGPPGVPPPVQ